MTNQRQRLSRREIKQREPHTFWWTPEFVSVERRQGELQKFSKATA